MLSEIMNGTLSIIRYILVGSTDRRKKEMEDLFKKRNEEFCAIKNRIEAFVTFEGDGDSGLNIPVNFEFPLNFVRQRMKYIFGDVEWRNFASGVGENGKKVISGQIKFHENSGLASTYHKNATTYLYVITGKLYEKVTGTLLTPYVEVPFEIKPNQSYHILNKFDEECNFVIKYVMLD